jgi:tetratricopeptide (TPR) repeat protein
LAGRGAVYSAKAELTDALKLVAMAQDADQGTSRHTEAMIAGLTALREADDFAARDGQPDVRIDVARLAATHATPVLKNSITPSTSAIEGLQVYYAYARQQLAVAGGHDIGASMALYGLARLQVAQVGQPGMNGPKAITLHQAALAVDANNYLAANELGVLLARYGQLREAETALKHSIAISPQPESWRNLAEVYRRQGTPQLEHHARKQGEEQLAARRSGRVNNPAASGIVEWVDPATFVAMSEPGPGSAPAGEMAAAAAATASQPESATAPAKPWSLPESIRGLTSRIGQSTKR